MKKIICLALCAPVVCMGNFAGKRGIELVDKLDIKQYFVATKGEPTDSGYASFLLKLNEQKDIKTLRMDQSTNPYGTELKKTLSALTLANSFKPVPLPEGGEVIGYSVIGTYKKNGWTGAKEFFTAPKFGVCSYSQSPFIYMQLEKSAARYDVNNKLTTIDYEGTGKKGYLTSVSWYDNGMTRTEYRLECAGRNKDKDLTDRMIELANKIDLG